MIIQALNDYYKRLKEDPEVAIPMFGFSIEKISFALVLSEGGELLQVDDLRDKRGKKPAPKSKLVPTVGSRSSDINPNFMWDNTKYVLGRSKNKKEEKKFEAFKKLQHSLCDDIEDKGVKAVLRFLDSWSPDALASSKCYNDWKDMADTNIIFQLDGVNEWVHDRKSIQDKWEAYFPHYFTKKDQPVCRNICLASGNEEPIAQKHIIPIKGVGKDQTSMVSFNKDAFCSYNKAQSYNAPVSERVVFNYATTLNHLLQFDSRQKVQIGDATTVFWAEGNTPLKGFLKDILDPTAGQADTTELGKFLERVRDGKMPPEIEDTKDMTFYILGLSLSGTRLSIRFWHVNTVEDISMKVGQHFDDLRIIRRYDNEPEYPGIWHLLHELELSKKDDKNKRKKIKDNSPLLAGAFFRSIITGEVYPRSILTAVIQRIRATQEINYLRASLIKAYLNRKNRIQKNSKEVTMALNKEETNIGYLLGRLFATLEKAQKDAIPKANATIKDRYYGSASATPSVVFPQLMRLAQHHISKEKKYGYISDKRITCIMQEIQKFPAHLNLEDQGMFAIGYYHQQPELCKSNKDKSNEAKKENE